MKCQKSCFDITALRLTSEVRMKVEGQGQGQGHKSKSRSMSNFWHVAVDIRGLALPSAAKSSKNYYSQY